MWTFFLCLYGAGCGVSQSLMSLGGAAFAFFALLRAPKVFALRRTEPWVFRAYALGLAWTAFSLANLLLRPWDGRSAHTLGAIPLLLVPLAAFPALTFSPGAVLWTTVAGLAASLIKGAWQFFALGEPATAFLRNPIYLAYNLLPAVIFFGEYALRPVHRDRFPGRAAGATSISSTFGIFLTLTRTALTTAFAYFGLRALPALRRRAGGRGLAIVLLLLVGAGVSAYRLFPPVREKVDRTFSANDPSREWRLKAWRYNWELFLASPIVGTGPERNGILPSAMPEYQGHWAPQQLYFAHSVYLQSLADSGLVGTLLFLAFWGALALASPALRPLLAAVAFAGLTENIFNNSKAAHAVFFYALLTLAFERRRRDGSA